jgi:predicted dehydrogenase
MTVDKKLRTLTVGVVGCGWNSDNHLRVYSNTEGVRLAAVCDRNQAKAQEKACRYGADKVFSNYESMLGLDLDLVDIVTPTQTHAELSRLALESDHNVLVEKPMALTSKQCLSMIDAAKKNGRTLCVVHNKRFFDCVTLAKAAVEREGLKISRFRFSHFFAAPYSDFGKTWILTEESGGVLWDGLVHHVYLCEDFLGRTESVYAVANKVKESVFDSVTLVLNSQGKTGLCEFEWGVREPLQVFQLLTERGDRFDCDLMHGLLLRRSRPYRNRKVTTLRSFSDDLRDPLIKWAQHLRDLFGKRPYEKALPYERTFFVLIGQLLAFLSGATSSPPVTADEGLQSIRVLEAAKRSIETGKAETIL